MNKTNEVTMIKHHLRKTITKFNYKESIEFSLIENKRVYRIIPAYTSYAVSKIGDIILIQNSKAIKQQKPTSTYHYYTVQLKNNSNTRRTTVGVHRLVALAWCENDDYVTKNIVDHKDGNKSNNHYSNLRWVSVSINTINKKRIDKLVILNLLNDEIIKCSSFSEVSNHTNVPRKYFSVFKLPYNIDNSYGKFIVYDIDKGISNIDNIYKYIIKINDIKYRFNNITDIKNKFSITIGNVKFDNIIKTLKQHYDIVKIIKQPIIDKKYDCKHVLTGELYTNLNRSDIVRMFNIPNGSISSRLTYAKGLPINNVIIKYTTDDTFPEIRYSKNKPSLICLTNLDTNIKLYFKSIRKLSKFIGKDRRYIKYCIDNNKNIKINKEKFSAILTSDS